LNTCERACAHARADEDANNGTQLSNPGFYRKYGAHSDAFGIGSNRMLSDVAQDAINYINVNR